MTAVMTRPDGKALLATLKQEAADTQAAVNYREKRVHTLNNLSAALTLMGGGKRRDRVLAAILPKPEKCSKWQPTRHQTMMLAEAALAFEAEVDGLDASEEAVWQALIMGLTAECWWLAQSTTAAQRAAQRCLVLAESVAGTCEPALDTLLEARVECCQAVLKRHTFVDTTNEELDAIALLLPTV